MRKIIAGAIAAALISGTFVLPVGAEEENDAAVSGYVSMTAQEGSVELASERKTPVIHIDDSDYEGVIRAANDLVTDIETVTDVKPAIDTSDIIIEVAPEASGITMTDAGMNVRVDYPLPEGSQGYIAVYNADNTLAGVKMSTGIIGDDVIVGFTFDERLTKPADGKIKAFIWKDMEPVTMALGMMDADTVDLNGIDVVIGTLGESETIDALVESGKLNVSEIEGKWESFTIQNVDDTIVIAGSDKRGTIYGIYDLSEKIGVSPWYFWADTVTGHADSLYINLPAEGYTEGEPSVKYRGIFINDEFNMKEWSASMGSGNMNNETYEKIFELLLRLKANYLWPAMHKYSTAFNVTEGNAELADMYGIVMGSSHCEPILRNNLGELYSYQTEWLAEHPDKKLYINTTDESSHKVSWMWTDKDGSGNAVDNKEFLTDYWRARLQANGGYENTYTLGMRGVHDGQFSTNMNGLTAMNEIIAAQTEILTEEAAKQGKDISEIPQVFIPYKEMLNLYNQGVNVPDYVTLMWTDDNFGYIRQLPTEDEAKRSGGAGVYYHLSYYGRPMSYLWLGTTQLGLIREEMTKAYDMDAKEIWVANVGDLKPAETEIEYFLDLARDVETMRDKDLVDWLSENAERDFGMNPMAADRCAEYKLEYYELANSRRPEHMSAGLYSLTDFEDEAQALLERYQRLERQMQLLYNNLDPERQPSFYELMLYPVKCACAMAEKYVYADKAQYYVDNSYGAAANKYAALSDAAYDKIVSYTNEYNTMLNGKWNKMMNPFQTQLRGSTFGGTVTGKLSPPTISVVPYTQMTIVPEGGSNRFDFKGLGAANKFIDIINSGSGSFDWRATKDAEWILLSKTSGTVADDDRIYVGVERNNAHPKGSEGTVTIERIIGDTVIDTYTIAVTRDGSVIAPELSLDPPKVYYESDGYVSIEAEHYTNSVTNGDYEWRVEKYLGRKGDSVKIYPNRAAKVTNPNMQNSAYLEYSVHFKSSGTFPIDVYRMPTINELSGATLRCRIGVDEDTPVQFNGTTKTADNSVGTDAWGKGVMQNTEVISGTITVKEPGTHTIRLYNEDPGVVIDKFVITTGEKKASYYGAPESHNSGYPGAQSRTDVPGFGVPSEPATEQTGNITALFEPSALIAEAGTDSAKIVKIGEINNGILIEASYCDGEMLEMASIPVDLSDTEINAAKTVEYDTKIPSAADTVQYMLVSGIDVNDDASFEALSPAVETSVPSVNLFASYDNGYAYPAARMNDYYGRESVCVIADTSGDIKYIRQNTVGEKTYEKIPFNGNGKYDLKIKVAGEDGILSETFSTIHNIDPDVDPTSETLYNWDFSTDQTGAGKNVPVLGGPAAYDSSNKAIKLTPTATAGGSVSVDFDGSLTMQQGEKLTVVTKIAYGKLNGKYTNYTISDSKGNPIVYSHITAYNAGSQLIQIGGNTVFEATSSLPDAIVRDNNAIKAGYTTYTTAIDCSSGEVTLVLSSSKGTETYTGKLPSGASYDVSSIVVSTDYTNTDRSCYVDDISIAKSKSAAYTITFMPVSEEQDITNAQITVTDGLTGVVIEPDENGNYILCDGIYYYTVEAEGYEAITDQIFELSQATESKIVEIPMTAK